MRRAMHLELVPYSGAYMGPYPPPPIHLTPYPHRHLHPIPHPFLFSARPRKQCRAKMS